MEISNYQRSEIIEIRAHLRSSFLWKVHFRKFSMRLNLKFSDKIPDKHLWRHWSPLYCQKWSETNPTVKLILKLTSALCMIAVSIDRAILIYLSRPLTRNQAWAVCVGIWILSYTITIPTLIHSKVHIQNKYKEQVISERSIRIDVIPKKSGGWGIRMRNMTISAISCCVIIKLYQLHDIITW